MKLPGGPVGMVVGAALLFAVVYFLFRTKPATPKDVDVAVDRALISERDPNVLKTFAQKLDAAGRTTQAVELLARAAALEGRVPIASAAQAQVGGAAFASFQAWRAAHPV